MTKFKCNECPESFTSKRYVEEHVRVKHRGKRFNCSFCPLGYSSKRHLDRHAGRCKKLGIFSPNPKMTTPCGKCSLCNYILSTESLPHNKSGLPIEVHSGGNCRTKNTVYALYCKEHNYIQVGQTEHELSNRNSKHSYDIKNRPNKFPAMQHFYSEHKKSKSGIEGLEVLILQSGLTLKSDRQDMEEIWKIKLGVK